MIERIKQCRKALGLSQEKFANGINMTQNYIALLESGKRGISDRTISDICREYNVNEEWLRTGEGEMFRKVTDREELAKWVAEINALPTTAIQRRVAHMLTLLEPQDWITIDKMINAMMKEGE